MGLKRIKIAVAAVWLVAIVVVGILLNTTSGGGLVMLAAFALLPPLAMWRLWNDPVQTMSESIQAGRR
jgi:hypothetical protein